MFWFSILAIVKVVIFIYTKIFAGIEKITIFEPTTHTGNMLSKHLPFIGYTVTRRISLWKAFLFYIMDEKQKLEYVRLKTVFTDHLEKLQFNEFLRACCEVLNVERKIDKNVKEIIHMLGVPEYSAQKIRLKINIRKNMAQGALNKRDYERYLQRSSGIPIMTAILHCMEFNNAQNKNFK